MAYARLSAVSASLGRFDDEVKYAQEAYNRRDRVSERERFYIHGRHCVVENAREVRTECAMTTHEQWKRAYPRDWLPYSNLAGAYASRGQYERALENGLEAIRLNPDGGIAYMTVIDSYIALDRYAEAARLLAAAEARRVFSDWMHVYRFELAFAAGDQAAMARERLAVSGGPTERDVLWSDADVAAFRGRLTNARILRTRVEQLFGPQGRLTFAARAAMFDAAVGLPFHMPDDSPPMPNIARYTYAVGAALAGDVVRAARLLRDDKIPPDSRRLVTACRALIGAISGDRAVTEEMAADASAEMGESLGFGPAYLRGLAYLHLGAGANAIAEFQRIIMHRGVDLTSPLYPLAYVQRARAHVIAGDPTQARRDYQTFLRLWADADVDVPILQEAKAEYAKLVGP